MIFLVLYHQKLKEAHTDEALISFSIAVSHVSYTGNSGYSSELIYILFSHPFLSSQVSDGACELDCGLKKGHTYVITEVLRVY